MSTSVAITDKLESIVGAGYVCQAKADDAVAGVQPERVVSPGNERELAAVLACANEAGVAVIPRGGGTKLDWGNPLRRAAIVVSTLRLSQVLEHAWADLTVTVEAGCTVQELQNTLAQHGQRLALDALSPERATIGGVLSTNDSGALRLRFGSLRDLIIGVTLALPDGTLASSGGKVVKNVAGYDLPKLATGALGTLGVITRAVFRLHPLCRDSLTVTFTAASIDEMQDMVLKIQDSQLAHTALQIRCGSRNAFEGDVLFEATPAGLAAQRQKLQASLAGMEIDDAPNDRWSAKQHLWEMTDANSAIAKICVLPTDIGKAMRELGKINASKRCEWEAVLQATGIGWFRIFGAVSEVKTVLQQFRRHLESNGGSLVVLRQPPSADPADAWGDPGDAIGVMSALKQRLDPKSTLNPGRFVGGI